MREATTQTNASELRRVDMPTTPRLRPPRWIPILGTVVGVAAGFAFYWFYGCDSG